MIKQQHKPFLEALAEYKASDKRYYSYAQLRNNVHKQATFKRVGENKDFVNKMFYKK